MNSVTIYHNPQCGTSRNVLAHVHELGIEPIIIEYLKTPLTRLELTALLQKMAVPIREVLRSKEPIYNELNLSSLQLSDDVLIDTIMTYPILINRPIVETELTAKLCRPSESVLTFLSAN